MEAIRMLMVKRGNIQKELSQIGEDAGEGTEIQQITIFKLMKAFEKAMQKYSDRINKPVHTVVQYRYTMEASRNSMLDLSREQRTVSFEKIFQLAENRVHAIFLFLSLLELVQQKFMKIIVGDGMNNFLIEYNEPDTRLAELEADPEAAAASLLDEQYGPVAPSEDGVADEGPGMDITDAAGSEGDGDDEGKATDDDDESTEK